MGENAGPLRRISTGYSVSQSNYNFGHIAGAWIYKRNITLDLMDVNHTEVSNCRMRCLIDTSTSSSEEHSEKSSS